MSQPYVEIDCDLHDRAQVLSVARALSTHVDHVVGALHRLWARAYLHGVRKGRDFIIRFYTKELFEEACGLPGITEQLVKCGWVAISDDSSLIMVRGAERFRQTAKERIAEYERDRKRAQRERKAQPSPAPKSVRDNVPDKNGTVPRKQSSSRAEQHPQPQQEAPAAAEAMPPAQAAAKSILPGADAALLPEQLDQARQALAESMACQRIMHEMGLDLQARRALGQRPGLTSKALWDIRQRQKAANITSSRAGWARRAIEAHLAAIAPKTIQQDHTP